MRRQAITLQGRTPLISHPVIPSGPPPPPPPPESVWTLRESWPFDDVGISGRAIDGCWSLSRERFLVLGFARDESSGLPIGDPVGVSDDDGVTWDSRTLPWDVAYPGNMCVARSDSLDRTFVGGPVNGTGTASRTAYSDDGGDTWTQNLISITGSAPDYYPYPNDILCALWIEEQSQFVIGTSGLATSPTGVTWTKRILPYVFYTTGGSAIRLAYSPVDDRIVMVNGYRVFTSDDAGVTWVVRTTPLDNLNISFVEWCPSISKFIAGGGWSGGTQGIILSADGITWSSPTTDAEDPRFDPVGNTAYVFHVVDIGPQLLAARDNFFFDPSFPFVSILASDDSGASWAESPSGQINTLRFVVGDDVVLALGGYGNGGAIRTSPIPVGTI